MVSIDEKLMKNIPYFDFIEAEDFGFDIQSFQSDGFKVFVKCSLISDFIKMRKNFITRDLLSVRFFAHKFKGCFSLMKSDIISENTMKLMKLIDLGNLQVSDTYVDLIIQIHIFFQELITFAQKISKNDKFK